jgi:hypothetical protein
MDTGAIVYARGNCHIQFGWDLNGDGERDVVRYGQAGMGVIDLSVGEEVAALNDVAVDAVAIPRNGPTDIRGQGAEVISVELAENALLVRYHEPIDLDPQGEAQTARATNAVFVKASVYTHEDDTRVVAQFDRGGQQYLQLYEPGRQLRRMTEVGPFIHLHWQTDIDSNGDGQPDLMYLGGSDANWINTDVKFIDLRTGQESYVIDAERSARFEAIWTDGPVPGPADLDGCPGFERVILRSAAVRADGNRATRVTIFDEEGIERYRSEAYDGRVHSLLLLTPSAGGPADVVELRSVDAENAILRIFSAPVSAED